MSSTANGWPRAVVTMDATGRAHVNLSGVVTSFEEGDADAVRTSVIRFIVQRALVLGREIPASITEPDDHWEIIIHPDGMVTESPLTSQDSQGPGRPDEGAAQPVQPPMGPAMGPAAQPDDPFTAGYGYVPAAAPDSPPATGPLDEAAPAGPSAAPPSIPPSIPPSTAPAHHPVERASAPGPAQALQVPPGGSARHDTATASVETPPSIAAPGPPPVPADPQALEPPAAPSAEPALPEALPASPFETAASTGAATIPSTTAPTTAEAGPAAPAASPPPAGQSGPALWPAGAAAQSDPPGQPAPAGQAPSLLHQSPDTASWQQGVPPSPQEDPAPGAAAGPRPADQWPGPLGEDRAPARTGLRGAMNRVGLSLRPSRSEQDQRRDIAAVAAHWSGSRTIAVVNGKGGSMKTPTTILLSALFARHGGTGVVAFDNSPARGTLGWRTEQGPHGRTVIDLLPSIDRLLSPEAGPVEISAFTHHQDDGFDVLRSRPELLADGHCPTDEDFTRVHGVLSWYYRLVVVDSGNDEGSPAWRAMIARADAIVVPTITRPEHAESARLLLSELAQRDAHGAELASGALVVVSQSSAAEPGPDELASRFQQIGHEAVAIPYDPMMAGRPLQLRSLAPGTQRAWLHAAARLAARLH